MLDGLNGEITALRSRLALQTPSERNSEDRMGDLADSAGHDLVRFTAREITRVNHGHVGPAGDNSDPDERSAAGADAANSHDLSARASILVAESEGRALAGLS